MFESIIGNIPKVSNVSVSTPKFLSMSKDDEEVTAYEMYKGALNYFYKTISLKQGTSEEVHKKSRDIWKSLIDNQLQAAKDDMSTAFDLEGENLVYVLDNYNNIIDMYDMRNEGQYNKFMNALDSFKISVTTTEKTRKFYNEGKDGTVKLVCYDKNIDIVNAEYVPVVFIEFNNRKSTYNMYTGILLYNTFTFIPNISAYTTSDSYIQFILEFNLDNALEYSTETSKGLYETYKSFCETNPVISVREAIDIFKKVGYKLELDENNNLEIISQISDETNAEKMTQFFNSFVPLTGESAYDLLSLNALNKMFRYNKLTILDVIATLSKEYLTYSGSKVTVDVLCDLIYKLYNKLDDKYQTDGLMEAIIK